MEAHPPYRSTGDQHTATGLSVISDVDAAVMEIEVHGRWSRRLCLDVFTAMRDCLAEQPLAIIVDLRDLSDLDAASTTMWLTASRAANSLRPPARLVLSLPPTRQLASHLRRLGAVRFLPIYATMKQARDAVEGRLPSINRLHLNRLRPDPCSASMAADAVSLACAAWGLPDLADSGRQIMQTLVSNAVQQGSADVSLAISLRGTGLHLAVHDGDHALSSQNGAASIENTPMARPGTGQQVLDSRASAWGAVPTRDGKVIWAILHPRRRPPS